MILVVGETIVDLISLPHTDHSFAAHLGGSPFNVAMGLGKLASQVGFLGNLSRDFNGIRFRESLRKNQVQNYSKLSNQPSSLAWIFQDKTQKAHYSFYLENTCLSDLDFSLDREVKKKLKCLFYGSIASYRKDLTNRMVDQIKSLGDSLTIAYDPNIREKLITEESQVAIIKQHLDRANIIKMSDEDFNFIFDQNLNQFREIAQKYLKNQTQLFVVTLGANGCAAFNQQGAIELPNIPTHLIDTIGAGDCFTATLLHTLFELYQIDSPDQLRELSLVTLKKIIYRSLVASSLNCEKKGACPPSLSELDDKLKQLHSLS